MSILSSNIRALRKSKGLTQEDLAHSIGVKRSNIGAYEEGRARPKSQALQNLAAFFKTTVDHLTSTDLRGTEVGGEQIDLEGRQLRTVSIVVDPGSKELVTAVPQKAAAGYSTGYSDNEYLEKLPAFNLPLPEMSSERTYRMFQIRGESMLPVRPGSYIICEYVQNWKSIKDNFCYVLVTKHEGIIYKRVVNEVTLTRNLLLKSDNREFDAYEIPIEDVMEVWKAIGYVSFIIPEPGSETVESLTSMLLQLKGEVDQLKKGR